MTVVTNVMINHLPLILLFILQNYTFSTIYFFYILFKFHYNDNKKERKKEFMQ